MLTRREIQEMFVASFRSLRRRDEVAIVDDITMVDELFQIITDNNVQLTAEQWDEMDNSITTLTFGGQNIVHPEIIAHVERQMQERNLHPALASWAMAYTGKIFFFIGENVEFVANEFASDDHKVSRVVGRTTFVTLAHERRHSYQDPEDLIRDAQVASSSTELMQIHDDLPTEVDANRWMIDQLNFCYGM